ncbi:MAG: hypothetical protein ACKOA8_15605, partial [Deltaproteobacteria bacterium]
NQSCRQTLAVVNTLRKLTELNLLWNHSTRSIKRLSTVLVALGLGRTALPSPKLREKPISKKTIGADQCQDSGILRQSCGLWD